MPPELKLDVAQAYERCGLGEYVPNPMQREMFDLVSDAYAGCAALLKAPTGTGKMEAVTVPALTSHRRLVLIYPAISLLEDQEMRIARMLMHLSQMESERVCALVVDTGADMYRRVWRNGEELHPERRERRHLLHGDVVLTTLDKFLYRFFGFGEPKKGYIYPLRLRYGRQPIYCFDEAHSYDDIAFTNFVDLVRAIGFNSDAPRDVVVMSATMPAIYADELKELLAPVDYTTMERAAKLLKDRQHPGNSFDYRPVSNGMLVEEILAAITTCHRERRRTIVAVERVHTAIELYQRLRLEGHTGLLLYHGHQPHERRRDTYGQLKQREREGEGYLLVTTSAIEVGCDLDAHTLISQMCNPEQLAQRAGRCNRRGLIPDAQIVVVGERIEDFERTVTAETEARYVELLTALAKARRFDPAQFLGLPRTRAVPDYRVRTMFTMLYKYVYEAERTNKPLHDRGLIITRSWEPTITLTTGDDAATCRLDNPLQVPISRCTAFRPEQVTPECAVMLRSYDEYAERYRLEPPKYGGWIYHQDIVVRVPPAMFDAVLGYVQTPKVFVDRGRRGYQHLISYEMEIGRDDAGAAVSELVSKGGDPEMTAEAAQRQVRTIYWRYLDRLPRLDEDGGEVVGGGNAELEDVETISEGVEDDEE